MRGNDPAIMSWSVQYENRNRSSTGNVEFVGVCPDHSADHHSAGSNSDRSNSHLSAMHRRLAVGHGLDAGRIHESLREIQERQLIARIRRHRQRLLGVGGGEHAAGMFQSQS